MHDIKRLREDAEGLAKSIARKNFKADTTQALAIDDQWRKLITDANDMKAEQNKASKAIGMAKREGRDAAEEMEAARKIRERIAEIDDERKKLEQKLREVMLTWPAEPQEDVPEGVDESGNVVIDESPERPRADFELHDHLWLSENLGILDMNRGAKITGSAWPMYVGLGATLERALLNFMLDTHIREHGYKELFPPFAVNRDSLLGTGQLPKLEEDMYHIEKEDFFLIPTSEVPITNMHRDEILKPDQLPIKYTAYSSCFRREAGAYGADTRGLLRVHQFNKVELVQIVEPEKSEEAHQEILAQARKILDALEIQYRVLELCGGELSFAASKCYDIEVYAPGQDAWLEASSVSNFLDFQARRMNLRYKPDGAKKPVFPHTLNGSGLATSRLMVAILESYQTPEGRVMIPSALRPYMGNVDQIRGTEQ